MTVRFESYGPRNWLLKARAWRQRQRLQVNVWNQGNRRWNEFAAHERARVRAIREVGRSWRPELGWPDLAWAGACRSTWVGPGPCVLGRAWVRLALRPLTWVCRSSPEWLLTRGEKGKRREEEEKEERREKRGEKREIRERRRREREEKKNFECSDFPEVETRLYSVRIFRKTREVTDLSLSKIYGYHNFELQGWI